MPQGSVLSPKVFNAIIAPLPYQLPSSMCSCLYVDDTCIWAFGAPISVIQQQLQEGMDVMDTFPKERGMYLSPSKSAVLPFTLKHL